MIRIHNIISFFSNRLPGTSSTFEYCRRVQAVSYNCSTFPSILDGRSTCIVAYHVMCISDKNEIYYIKCTTVQGYMFILVWFCMQQKAASQEYSYYSSIQQHCWCHEYTMQYIKQRAVCLEAPFLISGLPSTVCYEVTFIK